MAGEDEQARVEAQVESAQVDQAMDRRTFVRRAGAAGAALAAVAAAGPLATTALAAESRHPKLLVPRNRIAIGLEEYAFSQVPPADPYDPLNEMAEIGYRGTELIEFGGFGSVDRAREVERLLEKARIRGLGNFHLTYATPKNLRNALDTFIAEDRAAGLDRIGMVASEHTPEWQNEEAYKRQAADFNTWAAITKQHGLLFYVHNEAWVFDRDPTTGKVLYDVWIEETDPELVFFVYDVMWPAFRGFDNLEYIERLEDRILQFHIKDWNGQQPAPGQAPSTTQTDPGDGVIDFRSIFKALRKPQKYWYIVEREGSPDPSLTARKAYAYLSSLSE